MAATIAVTAIAAPGQQLAILARLSQKVVHSLIADQILGKALIDLGWGAGQSEIAQAKTKGKKGGKQNSVHSRLHTGDR
jgi:hypothetical protein